jgi:hypothetical protein
MTEKIATAFFFEEIYSVKTKQSMGWKEYLKGGIFTL